MAEQHVVVVTGALGALGAALVEHLVAAGHRVAAVDRAPSASSGPPGSGVVHYSLDATSTDGWRTTLDRVEHDLGPVDGAALIAGGWRGGAPIHDPASAEHWRAMLDANLETVHAALATLVTAMVTRGRGSIVV